MCRESLMRSVFIGGRSSGFNESVTIAQNCKIRSNSMETPSKIQPPEIFSSLHPRRAFPQTSANCFDFRNIRYRPKAYHEINATRRLELTCLSKRQSFTDYITWRNMSHCLLYSLLLYISYCIYYCILYILYTLSTVYCIGLLSTLDSICRN